MKKMVQQKALLLTSLLVVAAIIGGVFLPVYSIDNQEESNGFPRHSGPRGPPWMCDLTDDQKVTLRDLVEGMKDDGATKEEIREAVHQQLADWGIDVPKFKGPRGPP
jgi:hypothetical protein